MKSTIVNGFVMATIAVSWFMWYVEGVGCGGHLVSIWEWCC